jgi:A118 family predicted phage portal protein
MKLDDFLVRAYGYNPDVKNVIQTYIDQWKSWYVGNVKSFHNYYIYNGNKKVRQKRFTMNMAKEISEDWSDILWSEKCEISLKDESSQNQFNDLINDLDLYSVINQLIEKSGALGTESSVVSVYDIVFNGDEMTLDVSNAKTRVDLVDIDWIYPLSWNNKGITECAFGSVEYKKGQKYVVLTVHKINEINGNYVIYNHLFQETNGTLTEIEQKDDTFKVFDTKANIPWFSIFKPLLTNNLFNNSPFGIPHYANAIDNMKAVDISFDALKNEIKDGKRRTFVRAEMMNYDDGTQKMTFDPEDTTVYQLPNGATKDDLIQSDSQELRTDKQIKTLNTNLNILGNKVGFGENHYHFDGTNLSTATAVVSSNSKLFRRKKKLETGYESSIYDLIKAICYASSEFGKYNINSEDMVIKFDDSIVEDKEAESNRALREKSAGVISAVEYRMRIFGETKEIAEKAIAEMKEQEPSLNDMMNISNE